MHYNIWSIQLIGRKVNLLDRATGTTMFEKGTMMLQWAGAVVSGRPMVIDGVGSEDVEGNQNKQLALNLQKAY